jgi:Ca-activated chloride channel family protein
MRAIACLFLFVGLSMITGATALPQDVERPPILSVKTDLVMLPVTVVDRRGRFVPGLQREDFTVYDNGERRAIEFFTADDLPATIGMVIDSSGSMRGKREDVTAAATAFAAMSHPLDQFFTLNFNEVVWPGLPPSVAFTEDVNQLRAALSAARAAGMTALYDALDRALTHLQLGTRDRKALIVVSDGGDNASTQTVEAVIERTRRTGAAIYSIALFNPDDRGASRSLLKKLARDTGGRAFTPRSAEAVTRAFGAIARELRSGYTMGFIPPDTSAGGFRSIRVVVDGADAGNLTVRTRAGYHAGPSTR